MEASKKSLCAKIVLKQSLLFATLGLLAAFLLLALMGVTQGILFNGKFEIQGAIFVGVVALYAAAYSLGMVASDIVCRIGIKDPIIWLLGVGLAWSCLLISILSGSMVNFLASMENPPDIAKAFAGYIVAPVFWVMLFGGIPALGLGLLYAARVKKLLAEFE
ncbi:MAG TPA: hypothetical protein VIQ24_02010 [Pyrinomonadaceae bacterium]